MEIQSVINISKFIETNEINEFEQEVKRQIGYLSASVDKEGQQCIINIQMFEKEKLTELKNEIQQQAYEFFTHLNACVQQSNLKVLGEVFPSNEDVNTKVAKMSL